MLSKLLSDFVKNECTFVDEAGWQISSFTPEEQEQIRDSIRSGFLRWKTMGGIFQFTDEGLTHAKSL